MVTTIRSDTLSAQADAFAERITRESRSNLALAFVCLSRERRRDMNLFYAYCRLIDDIADDPEIPLTRKQRSLTAWRSALEGNLGALQGDDQLLCRLLLELVETRGVDPAHYLELIDGVEMDLEGRRYPDFEALRLYCHRVASVVGLVSIKLFGCQARESHDYAIALGLAFQLTNIIRDVGKDYRNGARIYLPLDEMEQHQVTEQHLAEKQQTPQFRALMAAQADRARNYYHQSRTFLTSQDIRSLMAAEIMYSVYGSLLRRMEKTGFRVLTHDYRLGKCQKLSLILTTMLAGWMNRPSPIHV